jgi:hypothetical protein
MPVYAGEGPAHYAMVLYTKGKPGGLQALVPREHEGVSPGDDRARDDFSISRLPSASSALAGISNSAP